MPILYCAVVKGKTVLAKYASCFGNFTEIINQVLLKIPPEDNKHTFSSDKYLFHYVAENELVYFCATDRNYPKPRAFSFLNTIKKKYLDSSHELPSIVSPFAMEQPENDDFAGVLEGEMTHYNDNKFAERNIEAELKALKKVMLDNIDGITRRGERLETLMTRADDLGTSATSFTRNAVQVERKYWWKNVKMYVILVVVLVLAVYLIGSAACGGLKWEKCV